MKNYEAEATKVGEWIKREHLNAKSFVDVACGTGEHAKDLKTAYSIDGIDLNTAFLKIAASIKPHGHHTLADMSAFNLGKRYAAIIFLFSSIGYVRTLEALGKTLQCLAAHLNPDGVVIVGRYLRPESWKAGHPNMVTISGIQPKVCRMNAAERTEEHISYLKFHQLVGTDKEVAHFTEEHTLGSFSVPEMTECFIKAALEANYDPEGIFRSGLYVVRIAKS